MNFKTVAVILAGGVGSRFKSSIPKQYVKVKGKKIIEHTISRFVNVVDEIVVVCNEPYFNDFNSYHVVLSGEQRYSSLDNAMQYIKQKFGSNTLVISHDGARPLVKEQDIKNVIKSYKKGLVVTLAHKATSSFWYQDAIAQRESLYEILTPQAIDVQTYFKKNYLNQSCTDLCSYAQLNDLTTEFVFTTNPNIKITHPEDIKYLNYYLGEENE